jgi:arsenate reductase-like glutaredoxin family protein
MWIYILQRDKSIIELKLSNEQYEGLVSNWKKGGVLIIKDLNNEQIGINSVDITKIMTDAQYQSWIDSSNPVKFIIKGNWFDRKSKDKPIRQERWKEEEIKKLLEEKRLLEEPITDEEKKIAKESLDRVRKMLEEKGLVR